MITEKQKEELKYWEQQIRKQGYKSICFLLVAYSVGGGTKYFIDLAKVIAENTNLQVYYADYEGGYAYDYFEKNPQLKVKNVIFNIYDKVFPIQEPVIIITSSTKIVQIKKMHPRSKVVLWHFETVPCAWELLFFNGEEKKFIKKAKKTKSLIYHDWSARDVLSSQFNEKFDNKDYLQVYSLMGEDYCPQIKEGLVNPNEINLVWVGRLVPDKINSLLNVIDNFAKYKTTKFKKIHIIGDGRRREELENYCKRYKASIQFIFKGTIPYEELADYLISHCDIAFSMGTSIINCAMLGIPSAVVLLSDKRFATDDYYWIFNTKEYCVGIMTDQKKRFEVPYQHLAEMLDSVTDEKKVRILSQKCFDYYKNNHSDFGEIAIKALRFSEESRFTYKKIKKLIRFTPYNIIEQCDIKIKGITLYKRIKFGNVVYFYMGKVLLGKAALNENGEYTHFGIFGFNPIFKLHIEKKCRTIENNYSVTKRILFLKITKRYSVGYKFPGSLFKENNQKVGK